jgi:hypothetical protein
MWLVFGISEMSTASDPPHFINETFPLLPSTQLEELLALMLSNPFGYSNSLRVLPLRRDVA